MYCATFVACILRFSLCPVTGDFAFVRAYVSVTRGCTGVKCDKPQGDCLYIQRIGETMRPTHVHVLLFVCVRVFVTIGLTRPLATVFSLTLCAVGVLHADQSIVAIEVWHDHAWFMNFG